MKQGIRLSNQDLQKLAKKNAGITSEMKELARQYTNSQSENSEFLTGLASGLAFVMTVTKLTPHEIFMIEALIQECAKQVLENGEKAN